MSLRDLVAKGDRRALVALRGVLADQIEVAAPQHIAGLARELRQVLAAISALPAAQPGSVLDEIRARREAPGRVASADAASAPATSQRGRG